MAKIKMYNGILICYFICELGCYNAQGCTAFFQAVTSIFPKTPRIQRSIPFEIVTEYSDYDRDKAVYLDEKGKGQSSISSCVCGENGDNPEEELWHLFIFIVINQETLPVVDRICSTTIIGSNLILTSHKCLQVGNNKMNIYDTWKPRTNMFNKSQIFISHNLCIPSHGLRSEFQILSIIYHPRYGLRSSIGEFPRSDVVLIKLDADFSKKSSKFKPICLKRFAEPIINWDSYGMALDVSDSFRSGNECSDMEKRARLKMYPDAVIQLQTFKATQHRGDCRGDVVYAGRENEFPHVKKGGGRGGNYNGIICIGYKRNTTIYLLEGSPWIWIYKNGKKALNGLSTNTTVTIGDTDVTIYVNGEDVLSYIFWRGNQEETKWCSNS